MPTPRRWGRGAAALVALAAFVPLCVIVYPVAFIAAELFRLQAGLSQYEPRPAWLLTVTYASAPTISAVLAVLIAIPIVKVRNSRRLPKILARAASENATLHGLMPSLPRACRPRRDWPFD